MASASKHFGGRRASDAQRRRLFAIACGGRVSAGILAGSREEREEQLREMARAVGCDRIRELTVGQTDELFLQLAIIQGGTI